MDAVSPDVEVSLLTKDTGGQRLRFPIRATIEDMKAAGFGFVRMDVMWANVERDGRYRWRPYDALLRALEARGMGVLWILDYGHPSHGGAVPRTTQDIAAFGQFAEAAAAYFKGRSVQYEIWNEPI
jgi:hypothetical protein